MSRTENDAVPDVRRDSGGGKAARITGLVSGGMFIDGYVLGVIGPVITPAAADLGMSVGEQGLIAAAVLIGIFFGGPLGGRAADAIGRRPMFSINVAVFLVASALLLFVDAVWALFAVRLVLGMAIGSDYSIGQPLLAEFAPARIRGRLLAVSQACWYLGFMLAFAVGFLLIGVFDADWRPVLATSAVPAALLLVARTGMPESPRWQRAAAPQRSSGGGFRELFAPAHARTTAFTSIFYFCAVTPYFAIATFAADVLADYGLHDGLAGGLAVNGLALAGVCVAVAVVERVGRRKLIIGPQWVCAAALLAVALWPGASGALVLGLFLVFAFTNAMCGALAGFLAGEVFPTRIRGIGCGVATAISRVGAAIGTFLLPWSMAELGASATMLVAAGLCAVGAAVAQAWAPEPTGRDLDSISVPRPGTG